MAKKGIDVSEHNGSLDWGKIGADFAIIRGGYGSGDLDGSFGENLKNCPIPYGIYWFSYAYTVERAEAEAEFFIAQMKKLQAKPRLPVFFDWEYDSDRYAKENGVTVNKQLFSAMAIAFMEKVRVAGYRPGIYYNHDYYQNYCDPAVLNPQKYAQWYAYYGETCGIDCHIWQYTQSGKLGGFTGDINELRNEELLMSQQSRVLKTGANEITNPYGGGHGGVDLVKSPGSLDQIIAHTAGEVVFCQQGIPNDQGSEGNRSYGNCVKLRHKGGYCTLYAHLDSVKVHDGEKVKQGQTIGAMGNTGNSYGAHLHFEVRNGADDRVNPEPYLNQDLPGAKPAPKPRTHNIWLEKNKNGELIKFAVKVSAGSVWCQAHLLGGGWLPKITGFNPKEPENGYAGNGRVIDALRIYYNTPTGEPYLQARYSVNGLPEQVDDSTESGMDGYAGNFGEAVTSLKLRIGNR